MVKALSEVQVHVESSRRYTSGNLKEGTICVKLARTVKTKMRTLLTTKRTFRTAVLALLFRKVFGVKIGQERKYRGTQGRLLVA